MFYHASYSIARDFGGGLDSDSVGGRGQVGESLKCSIATLTTLVSQMDGNTD